VGDLACSSGYRVHPMMITDSEIDNLINEFLRVHGFPNSNKTEARAKLNLIIREIRSKVYLEAYEDGYVDGLGNVSVRDA
jgi:hypothetical protein